MMKLPKLNLSRKQQGHLIMFAVMTAFGINIPINKYLYASDMLSPVALVLLRMSFAALAFWIISLFTPKEKVERKDMLLIILGGIFGMVLNQGLLSYGISKTTPVDASIFTTSGPIFAMILAALFLKEPITAKKAGGVFVGILGAMILIYTGNQGSATNNTWQGDLSVLASQFFYAAYLVITRPLVDKYSSFTLMKWMFLIASLVMLPFSFQDLASSSFFYQHEVKPYLALAFVLIGATLFTYMLIPFAQVRIRPTTISMYNNVEPLVASVIAISIGMDYFSIYKVIAAIFIFGGVYLVTMSKSKVDLVKGKNK